MKRIPFRKLIPLVCEEMNESNPWEMNERPSSLKSDHPLYVFTNELGEEWIAYIDVYDNYSVWVSGEEPKWEWKKIILGPFDAFPWKMDLEEKMWLLSVLRMAHQLEIISHEEIAAQK
jgi:hypothetical protein